MADGQRRYDKNSGVIAAKEIPDDRYIVGAIVIMIDDDGRYSHHFLPGSLDQVPDAETQQRIGEWASTAYEIANLTRGRA